MHRNGSITASSRGPLLPSYSGLKRQSYAWPYPRSDHPAFRLLALLNHLLVFVPRMNFVFVFVDLIRVNDPISFLACPELLHASNRVLRRHAGPREVQRFESLSIGHSTSALLVLTFWS